MNFRPQKLAEMKSRRKNFISAMQKKDIITYRYALNQAALHRIAADEARSILRNPKYFKEVQPNRFKAVKTNLFTQLIQMITG